MTKNLAGLLNIKRAFSVNDGENRLNYLAEIPC